MSSGDTIGGKVRFVRVDTEGNREVVAGPYSTGDLDDVNRSLDPEDFIYLNTMMSSRKSAPAQAREEAAPGAQFLSGEQIILEAQSNTDNSRSIDHDFDAFSLDIVREDKNRGKKYPDQLTVSDQELSSSPSESATSWVEFYRETVPDRTEYRLVGKQAAAPIEV